MIDAGSQGTRIHVYEYAARILRGREEIEHAVNGRKLSFPTTNARWTNRLKPGLDFFASIEDDKALRIALREYLTPLFDFAKTVLAPKRHRWAEYPVYLKATGGMRTLPTPDRIRVMATVRDILFDSKFNPFAFEEERARVISGEEEAIYGWAAVNFVKGTLLSDSEGTGTVLNPRKTFGMLEMGGASTQIGYYESDDDVMADLFKLQIGGARHWNVYCHSYLFFGINGAFDRLNARLYAEAGDDARSVHNPCLPGFSTVSNYSTWIHYNTTDSTLLPRSDPRSTLYTISLYNDDDRGDVEACDALVYKLLRKEANKNWVMVRDLSIESSCLLFFLI
jgi:Golgi nucleoside diphosphatase